MDKIRAGLALTLLLALATVGGSGEALAAIVGPTGRYYVTDESGFNRVWQFQGATLTSFPTATSGADGPIVVDGNANRVRSVAGGFTGGATSGGFEYDLAGVVQGPVSLDFSGYPGYGRVIDAAFDGTNSYIVSGLFGAAGVVKYGGDFSGPGTLMFNIPVGFPQDTSQGITYDTTTNTIWTSDYNVFGDPALGGYVRQWSLTGTELFSFPVIDNTGHMSERNTALAYDFTDDTFWMNAHVEDTLGLGIGELWQFDRAGNFLQKIHGRQFDPTAPAGILYWGGEIIATGEPNPGGVPEAASLLTWSLLAVLGLVKVWRRRS
jgi:hypothetical protein